MSSNDRDRAKKLHLWGWLLFLGCAVFFIASAVKGGDILGLVGSVIFLVGCVFFIIPLMTGGNQDEDS